ncbi:MAG: hypothetical protein A2297_07135 [Elusimicrobia bacterium RIFOXYB2_FULL_48_7]|nr:MAG: hypothetical protein A2297_07135 [Elusimicrobia bacterium RIFOXYB2_FULL_48_7]
MVTFLVLGIVIAAIIIVFAIQNPATVFITFIAWQLKCSLAIALLFMFILGAIFSLLLVLPVIIRKKLIASKLENKIREMENKIEKIKST